MATTRATPRPDFSLDEVRAELGRILASRWLRGSHQLSTLLRFVVEETLAGHEDGLKEYNLGLSVFHRAGDYDPRSDSIVRVQASILRKKLQAYYETDGKDNEIEITLPRGGYVPLIQRRTPAAAPPPAPRGELPRRTARWPLIAAFGAGSLLTACAAWMMSGVTPPAATAPRVWHAFLEPEAPAVVSFGSPLFYVGGHGLYVRDVLVNSPGENQDGQIRRIEEFFGARFRPHEDVYTGIGEALGVLQLERFFHRYGRDPAIANSHYVGLSDLKGKNLIVVSSLRFQTPLQALNLPQALPFESNQTQGRILNPSPLPGEPAAWEPNSGSGGVDTSYAFLSVWPSPERGRRIMYLGGMHTWSTLAAVQYALDTAQQARLERRLDADPVDGPRGKKGPWIQVLLRAEGKYNQVRSVEYTTHRYLPASGAR